MKKLATLSLDEGISVLQISNPPVNAVSVALISDIATALDEFDANRSSRALVIVCEGRTFVAGADIAALDDEPFELTAKFNALLARIESSARPVVAAMHGTVLGGGLELALACHWRAAGARTTFGFPEVTLGLLPGSLGTQRLPRAVGHSAALELVLSGQPVGASEAHEMGLIDEILEGPPRSMGLQFAHKLLRNRAGPRRLSEVAKLSVVAPPHAVDMHSGGNRSMRRARTAIAEAIKASTLPFHEGAKVEARLFEELRKSPESRALRHLFFAQREASRVPDLSDMTAREVRKVGIVGAGTMGTGIAMAFANADIPVVIVDTSEQALRRGLGLIRSGYEATAAKGRMPPDQVERRIALVEGALSYDAMSKSDLVIEAVYEDMALKNEVCATLGRICHDDTIIASNTSTLDVNELARSSGRPRRFVGMHFFSPANVMRLLELVRGDSTAPEVLAAVISLAKKIGKIPVVSGVCYGFIGNRMAEPYMRETDYLLMEGATPAQIDAAIEALGFAMGPCRMMDMAGVDVGAKIVLEREKAGQLPPDPSYRAVIRKLYELGRFGQKSGAGYYRYVDRKPTGDPEIQDIFGALALDLGIGRRADITDKEIVERLLYPLINEGTKILEEKIADKPGDIDIVWTTGFGFPQQLGGPMFMADSIGLPEITARLRYYGESRGNEFGYWTVSQLMSRLSADGKHISNIARPKTAQANLLSPGTHP